MMSMTLDGPPAARYPIGMAREIPSVGDLRRKSEITDAEIEAAADAYLKDEGAPPFKFSSGHRSDVGRAIEMHTQAKQTLADEATTPSLRRTMVKTAIIRGFPVAGRRSSSAEGRIPGNLTLAQHRRRGRAPAAAIGQPVRRLAPRRVRRQSYTFIP